MIFVKKSKNKNDRMAPFRNNLFFLIFPEVILNKTEEKKRKRFQIKKDPLRVFFIVYKNFGFYIYFSFAFLSEDMNLSSSSERT